MNHTSKIILGMLTSTLLIEANYTNVVQYYKEKNYVQAIAEAKKSFNDYNNINLHLLWARSAQKLGKTTEAMAGYERVLLFNENHKEAKKALKNIYLATDRIALSDQISTYQDFIFKTNLHIATGFDSNIDINPGASALDEYYDINSNVTPISTGFTRFNGNLISTYRVEESPKWFVKGSLNLYNQTNFNAKNYNLTKISPQIGMGYSSENYHLYLPLSYHKMFFFSKNLLSDYTITPNVKISIFNDSILDIGASYTNRKYVEDIDKGRNFNLYGGHIGLYFPIINIPIHLDVEYEKREASQTQKERYINSNLLSFDASVNYAFTNTLIFNIHNILRYATYKDDIGTALLSTDTLRRDYINQTDLQVTYKINKKIDILFRNTYTKSYSNYIPAEYSKNLFFVGLNYKF